MSRPHSFSPNAARAPLARFSDVRAILEPPRPQKRFCKAPPCVCKAVWNERGPSRRP